MSRGKERQSAHYSLISRAQLLTGTYTHYSTQLFLLHLVSISFKHTLLKTTLFFKLSEVVYMDKYMYTVLVVI